MNPKEWPHRPLNSVDIWILWAALKGMVSGDRQAWDLLLPKDRERALSLLSGCDEVLSGAEEVLKLKQRARSRVERDFREYLYMAPATALYDLFMGPDSALVKERVLKAQAIASVVLEQGVFASSYSNVYFKVKYVDEVCNNIRIEVEECVRYQKLCLEYNLATAAIKYWVNSEMEVRGIINEEDEGERLEKIRELARQTFMGLKDPEGKVEGDSK